MKQGKVSPALASVRAVCAKFHLAVFNHPQYGLPQATFGVPGFGNIIQTVNTTTPVSPVETGLRARFSSQ